MHYLPFRVTEVIWKTFNYVHILNVAWHLKENQRNRNVKNKFIEDFPNRNGKWNTRIKKY